MEIFVEGEEAKNYCNYCGHEKKQHCINEVENHCCADYCNCEGFEEGTPNYISV